MELGSRRLIYIDLLLLLPLLLAFEPPVNDPCLLVLVTCPRYRSRSEPFRSSRGLLEQNMGHCLFCRKVHRFRTSVERSAQHWPMLPFSLHILSLSSGADFFIVPLWGLASVCRGCGFCDYVRIRRFRLRLALCFFCRNLGHVGFVRGIVFVFIYAKARWFCWLCYVSKVGRESTRMRMRMRMIVGWICVRIRGLGWQRGWRFGEGWFGVRKRVGL